VIWEWMKYLKGKGKRGDNLLPVEIKRPYELKENPPGSREYEDPNLQKRWEQIKEKYEIKTS